MEGLFLFGFLTGAFFWIGLIFFGLLEILLLGFYIIGRNDGNLGFWPVVFTILFAGIGLHLTGIPFFPFIASQWVTYVVIGVAYGLVFRAAWSGVKSAREFRQEMANKKAQFLSSGGTLEEWPTKKLELIKTQRSRGMSYYGRVLFSTVILWPFDLVYTVFGEVLADFIEALWHFVRDLWGNIYEFLLQSFTKDL